jgi:hypothetical protein
MYRRELAEDGETFSDVASRLGLDFSRGNGLYRVVKVRMPSESCERR